MKATLGLTGLTVNAMALIAPGAFLWLTYAIQAAYGAPMAGTDIWFGIFAALLLCFATAVSYAELSKLYPGAGSSYFFAEQAYLSKSHSYKFARIAKFIVGWASHLYYWVYPGLMVGVTALVIGYMAGDLWPTIFSSTVASPLLMIAFCVVFALGVGYIAYRGATASTAVNLSVNVVQISALLIFTVIAIGYRATHGETSKLTPWTLDPSGTPIQWSLPTFAKDVTGSAATFKPDADGNAVLYVVEDDGSGNAKTDAKGNYIFKKDDKGNLVPALLYTVEVDEKGDPKSDKDGNWIFAKDKDGKLIPAVTYKPELDKDANPKKDDAGHTVFAKGPDGKYIPDPKGQNLASDQNNPADHPQYFPDDKGVYVADPAGAALAITIPDKPAEGQSKADFDNLVAALKKDVESYKANSLAQTAYYRAVDEKGQPTVVDDKHPATMLTAPMDYSATTLKPDPYHPKQAETRQWFKDAGDVLMPHSFFFVFIQACIAILILVGFESITSMGEEAKNPKKHIPWAVLLSLAIQGGICYLVEYFAANYLLHPNYPLTTAAAATAPIGDMMKLTGSWLFGSSIGGEWFMRIEALTVFLALIGTTLACLNTGARVTYAMGRDDEVPSHFGLLHGKNLTPHRTIWTLTVLSIAIGIVTVMFYLCGPSAVVSSGPTGISSLDSALSSDQAHSIWYSFGVWNYGTYAKWIPNSLIVVTLISNFGTFLLYMMTCWIAIVAFREHHMFNGIKHMAIPVFGLVANLICMAFYLIGPWTVPGMSKVEPYVALGVVGLWGLYGWFYFTSASKKKGKEILLSTPPAPIPETAATGKEAFSTN
jgi:amino acid transporter